jgi:predicted SAM-dependent methyltransferase
MEEFIGKLIRKDQVGIEIGASFNPLAPKKDGWNIVTVDYATREELKQIYSYANVAFEKIEEVDVIWKGGSLSEAVLAKYPDQKFDYIIASHVIEHIPNLVSFFQDFEKLLKEDGVGILIVPDKRYTFDYLKQISTTADVVEAYIRKHTVHPLSTAFKTYFSGVYNGSRSIWGKNAVIQYQDLNFIMPLQQAYETLKDYPEEQYVDYHRWIFTENSFVLMIKELHHLDLIRMDIANKYSDSKRCDFLVCLKKNYEKQDDATWKENRLTLFKNMNKDLLDQLIHSDVREENDLNARLIRENSELEFELNKIYISRAWKFVKLLKQIRYKLIPENTTLHRLLVRILK